MSAATTFVLTIASVCSYLTNTFILAPLGLEYLQTISFILVIAVVVQFTEMVVHKTSPLLHRVLGVFLPLITTNCAVLGVALLNVNKDHNFIESLVFGFGAAPSIRRSRLPESRIFPERRVRSTSARNRCRRSTSSALRQKNRCSVCAVVPGPSSLHKRTP